MADFYCCSHMKTLLKPVNPFNDFSHSGHSEMSNAGSLRHDASIERKQIISNIFGKHIDENTIITVS